jgi:hypothetical protein
LHVFSTMKSRCDVTIAPSSVSPANFGLSLHTDQQNLILGEMINARNRLQEENQELRDSLQDAEMVIRLLNMKLEKERAANIEKREKDSREKDKNDFSNSPLRSRNFDWRSKRVIGKAKAYNKKAFLNVVAPGQRTFEPPSATSKVIKPTRNNDLTQEKGNHSPRRHRLAESPARRRQKPMESSTTSPSPSKRGARLKQESAPSKTKTSSPSPSPSRRGTQGRKESVPSKTAISNLSPSNTATRMRPGSPPPKTTIGRIVDEVIQEYSGMER